MGFFKNEEERENDKVFLDREDIFKKLEDTILDYKDTVNFYKLFTVYGMGGIGKSRLINQIYDNYNGTDLDVYKFHLEILNHETISSILLHIRQKFSYTPHFDYVLFKYWEHINYDKINSDLLNSISKNMIGKWIKKVDNLLLSGACEELIDFWIQQYEERDITIDEKDTVTILLQDKIDNLYQYMSKTLASDIENEIHGKKYMFIFDAYDVNGIEHQVDWLKDFVNAFQEGVFIITSRESLGWFESENINHAVVEDIPLESIPSEVIREYLLSQKFTNRQIDIILEKTDCIPLFLDIALKIFREDSVDEQTFVGFKNKTDLIKNLLSHLSVDEQCIVEYLSVIKLFNEEIYDNALEFNKLSCQKFRFSDFKESTIVRYIEEFNGLFKIHSVLANNIVVLMDEKMCHKIIQNYIEVIWARILMDELLYADIKYNLIVNAYVLAETAQLSMNEKITEQLMDMFFYLIDNSYGKDFIKYISIISNKESSSLKYIYQYIEGKMLRLVNIKNGRYKLETIPMEKCNFGKHTKTLQCDINYLLSISGNYNEAEKKMTQFAERLTANDIGQRYYNKGIIYDCDMKMLRGKFKTSVAGLLELTNNLSSVYEEPEIQKTIGHNYRFNFLLEEAMKRYSICGSERNMTYYYTVYCETNCYFNPQLVLDSYTKAKEENEKYRNHNNLGKIYYSMSIVKILDRKYNSAEKFIKKAYNEFNHTKYYAGNLFVMMAEAYLEYSKTKNISLMTIERITKSINKLDGIYEYLLLPIFVARKDIHKISEYKDKYEWFSYEKTISNITKFINQLQIL